MIKSLKKGICSNCGSSLLEGARYCHNCGQRVHESEESFKDVLKDFFSNYLAVDSRFGHTFLPFLFKPGFLTLRYKEGKRVKYANPIRLYLILSLIFFLIIGLWAQRLTKKGEQAFSETPDVQAVRSSPSGETMNLVFDTTDSDNGGLTLTFDTALINQRGIPESDTSGGLNWDKFVKYRKDLSVSNSAILDSMGGKRLTPTYRLITSQLIRISRARPNDYVGFIFKNLPFMMLVLVPIFALILKLLYVRRKQFFITHLIHGLHLHSFAYFLYGITVLLILLLPTSTAGNAWMLFSALFLVTLYSFFSFLRVYRQGKSKTIVKFILAGSSYFTLGIIFFLFEILISSLLF